MQKVSRKQIVTSKATAPVDCHDPATGETLPRPWDPPTREEAAVMTDPVEFRKPGEQVKFDPQEKKET